MPKARPKAGELHRAAEKGDTGAVNLVLEREHDAGVPYREATDEREGVINRTALHKAVEKGQLDTVRQLLHMEADPNAADGAGIRPLHLAAANDSVEICAELIENANLNAKTSTGETPAHHAAAMGSDAALEFLHSNKANIRAKNNDGQTPLHLAAANDLESTCDLLLQLGAQSDAQSSSGLTPLHVAAERSALGAIRLLLAMGANRQVQDSSGRVPADMSPAEGVQSLLSGDVKRKFLRSQRSRPDPSANANEVGEVQTPEEVEGDSPVHSDHEEEAEASGRLSGFQSNLSVSEQRPSMEGGRGSVVDVDNETTAGAHKDKQEQAKKKVQARRKTQSSQDESGATARKKKSTSQPGGKRFLERYGLEKKPQLFSQQKGS